MSNSKDFPGRFILCADITLTSPLHISALEKGRYNHEKKKITRYDDGRKEFPQCTLTRTRRLSDHSYVIKSSSDDGEDGAPDRQIFGLEVPIIPASTVGGRLRNAAADLIFESLVDRDLSISSTAYNTLCTGSGSTKMAAEECTPEVMQMARKEPFFANFGGTSFMLSSRSVIADGMPLLDKTVHMLMAEPLLDAGAILPHERIDSMTSALAIVRKDGVGELRGEHLQGVVPLDEIMAHLQQREENTAAKIKDKAAKKAAQESGEHFESGKKNDIRTISAMEVVDPGLSFALRVQVDAATAEQLGLMVLALQKVLRTGQFGGKGARGLGQFICQASALCTVDPRTNQITHKASLFGSKIDGYQVLDEVGMLSGAVDVAQDYLHGFSPAVLEAFAKTDAKGLKLLHEKLGGGSSSKKASAAEAA